MGVALKATAVDSSNISRGGIADPRVQNAVGVGGGSVMLSTGVRNRIAAVTSPNELKVMTAAKHVRVGAGEGSNAGHFWLCTFRGCTIAFGKATAAVASILQGAEERVGDGGDEVIVSEVCKNCQRDLAELALFRGDLGDHHLVKEHSLLQVRTNGPIRVLQFCAGDVHAIASKVFVDCLVSDRTRDLGDGIAAESGSTSNDK